MNGDSQDDLAKSLRILKSLSINLMCHKLENCNKIIQTDINSQSQHAHSDTHAHIFMLLTMSFWWKRK